MPTFRNTLCSIFIGVISKKNNRNDFHYISCLKLLRRWNRLYRKLAYKIHTPGNHPKVSTRHSEQGESLNSRTTIFLSHPMFRNITSKYFVTSIVWSFIVHLSFFIYHQHKLSENTLRNTADVQLISFLRPA